MTGRLDNRPEIGIGLFGTEPVARMVESIVQAEELGFASAWIGDSQNIWRDAYVTLGAAAMATHSIGLGTGVTNAVTRHVSALASAWASLAELATGRLAFGIGTGDSSLRTIGARPLSVGELERRIAVIRRLLAGEEVEDAQTGANYRLQFAPDEPIPIYVAAAGPGSLRMAGRVADGVIACVGIDPRLVNAALAHVAAGAADSGRDPRSIPVVLWTAVAIEDDSVTARDRVRAFTASAVIPPLVAPLDPAEQTAVQAVRHAYDYRDHMRTDAEHRATVPDTLVRRIALAGTPADCREQLAPVLSYPISQLALVPFAETPGGRDVVVRRLWHEVLGEISPPARP